MFIIAILFWGIFGVDSLHAQSFDHEKYPRLDFNFLTLELDLGIQPQNLRIDGAAVYEVEANTAGADTLTLYASHIDVSSVSVDGSSVDFSLSNDSLFIPVDDSASVGQRYEINIRYSGRPQFGLLKNANGTVWTSLLPRSQRHWVPIVDNPHVDLQTTFNFAVPSRLTVWATGQKTSEEAVSVDVVRYQFTSEQPVPASSLAFTVGGFNNQSTTANNKSIHLAAEQPLSDSIDSGQLLDTAGDYLQKMEDRLQFEYPYEQLNIILTEDHNWEPKSWGAGTVFLYQNRGNLETQLLRGIIGQWFGVYQREAQWSQADAITLYQTIIANDLQSDSLQLTADAAPEIETPSIYDNYSVERWNRWQTEISGWQNASVRARIDSLAPRILKGAPSVISWDDYADVWYQDFGQPLFDMPDFSLTENREPSDQKTDSVAYQVTYDFDEMEGQLKLRFESTHGSYDALTTLPAYEIYPNRTDTSEVTFTGSQDSVMLQVDPTIKTLRIENTNYPALALDEYKPVPFLIEELRNSETTAQRAEAARKLGYHKENPDLQLAIRDFIQKENEPEVEAALLSSMADITQGASGTEQMFLDALGKAPMVRDAALMALQNYENSASVQSRVESIAQNADEFDLFTKSTEVLTTITSQEEFTGFVETMTQRDSVGNRAVFAIQELANMGSVDEAVERANLFIGSQFDYKIRRRALEILIQHDQAPSRWLSRAEELLVDTDPRIRYLTVEGLERNQNEEVTSFLNERLEDEYDERVYKKMQQLLSS